MSFRVAVPYSPKGDQQQAIELLLTKLRETKSNLEFLMQIQKTTPSVTGSESDDA